MFEVRSCRFLQRWTSSQHSIRWNSRSSRSSDLAGLPWLSCY